MLTCRISVSALLLIAIIAYGDAAYGQNVKSSDIVGAWKLISIEDHGGAGEPTCWMGRTPKGMIMYDAQGNMSVQIVHDPSPLDTGSCRDRPTRLSPLAEDESAAQ